MIGSAVVKLRLKYWISFKLIVNGALLIVKSNVSTTEICFFYLLQERFNRTQSGKVSTYCGLIYNSSVLSHYRLRFIAKKLQSCCAKLTIPVKVRFTPSSTGFRSGEKWFEPFSKNTVFSGIFRLYEWLVLGFKCQFYTLGFAILSIAMSAFVVSMCFVLIRKVTVVLKIPDTLPATVVLFVKSAITRRMQY